MEKIFEFFQQTDLLASVLALIATLLGVTVSWYASFQKWRSAKNNIATLSYIAIDDNKTRTPEQRMREHLGMRMEETIDSIKKYNREASVQMLANNSLVFGQYVVGVALTSSFLQTNLTPTWIGVLGLIVLLTTVIHQRFRPDIKQRVAKAKVMLLRSTLRNIQDELTTNEKPHINNIIKRITKTLNRVEVEDSDEWISKELISETDQGIKPRDSKTG